MIAASIEWYIWQGQTEVIQFPATTFQDWPKYM